MKKAILSVLSLLVLVTVSVPSIVSARNTKPIIAVAEFKNSARAYWWRSGVGWELSDMLTNEMAATGVFRMVERSKLQHVLREQDFGRSGRVSKRTAARLGRITGAKYIVIGRVSAFERNIKGSSGGFGFRGIRIGGKSQKVYLAIDLRVINTTTGVIVHVRTVEARAKSKGLRVGLSRRGFSGSLGKHAKTPTGKVIRAVIIEASDYLACVMVERGRCLKKYKAREQRRRSRSRDSITLD